MREFPKKSGLAISVALGNITVGHAICVGVGVAFGGGWDKKSSYSIVPHNI